MARTCWQQIPNEPTDGEGAHPGGGCPARIASGGRARLVLGGWMLGWQNSGRCLSLSDTSLFVVLLACLPAL